jgi:serine/threonine-protein kinase HipA
VTRELRDLRRVDTADVHVGEELAAELHRTPTGTRFRYLPAHLARRGRPVATSLPLSSDEVVTPAGALPPFFAGLLPEGRRLMAVRSATKTSADDELTLLLAVGGDTVGHVRVSPRDEPPADEAGGAPEVAAAGEVSFAELFARAVGTDPSGFDRVALPGVQDKISGRMIAFPVSGPRGRYLLKLDPPEFPHLVANEAFFLRAARLSGLPTAAAEVITDRDGRHGLLVERFDRIVHDGGLERLAQEDACQVLGRYPADKYLLTTEEVVSGLAGVTTTPVVTARALLVQFAFAYLTGSGDAHAKNFSVYRPPGGEWRPTPAYDIPSSHPYGDTTMALPIDGKDREDITWRAFVALGEATGVPERAVRRTLLELTRKADRWVGDLDQLPFDDRRIHRLRRLIADRRAKLTPPPA